jgi:hypothetical protein
VQAVLDASGTSFELQEDTARRRKGGTLLTYLLASSPIISPFT